MEQVVLFYSLKSKKCLPVLNIIKQYGISVKLFCVDSVEVRKKIKNGSLFSVRGVPTLLVSFNNEAEVYEGEKVIQWLDQLIQSQYQPQQEDYYEDNSLQFASTAPQEGAYAPAGFSSVSLSKNSKEKQMDSVKDIAKQMEMERKRTIPDDEKMPF